MNGVSDPTELAVELHKSILDLSLHCMWLQGPIATRLTKTITANRSPVIHASVIIDSYRRPACLERTQYHSVVNDQHSVLYRVGNFFPTFLQNSIRRIGIARRQQESADARKVCELLGFS